MSAFVVSDKTISGILQAASPLYHGDSASYYWHNEPSSLQAQDAAQKLVNENYRSVNYRYNEAGQPHRYQPQQVPDLSAVEIIKLCHCYRYQACETPDWEESEAFAMIHALQERAIRRLPGYSEAKGDL